ncbi:hypothetical protein GHK86_08380 [Acidimicrobiaceae bacterium USS-CC1]|uniref:ABC-2 type transporter transmembrane domain-containing protein n=1 Tax=Acidiferrimicrobium australe TaxID=2664430 RepID=A0ABW9QSS9_9ACTN|nr:hypothetical protein [Acidiferrimicrobium australe]
MRLGWAHRPQAERRRARPAVELLPRFAWYHLLLVVRSPIGTFVSLVIPLMLLVALDLVTPEMTLRSLGGIAVAQFLTPSMAGFAVLNVGFVDVVIGVTLARDEGVLRRFRTSPAPLWAYFAGRFLTAAAVTAVAVAAVCGVGLLFMGVRLPGDEVANLAGWAAAGLVVCFALGRLRCSCAPLPARCRRPTG